MNDRLKGKDGKLQAVTDVRRIPLTVSDDDVSIPAKDGDNLVLSIDRNVQAYAESALKTGLRVNATKGSVVVMDPNNGPLWRWLIIRPIILHNMEKLLITAYFKTVSCLNHTRLALY